MKRIVQLIGLLSLALLLVACNGATDDKLRGDKKPATEENKGNTNPVDEQENDDMNDDENKEETSGSNAQNDQGAKMDALNYIEFELEVEYANGLEYEIELEKKKDGTVKAKIEDELNNVMLEGAEAFDELYPLVQKMTVTQETPKEDAIKEALEVFNLDEDYTEFELEITFKDGTEIEYKDKR